MDTEFVSELALSPFSGVLLICFTKKFVSTGNSYLKSGDINKSNNLSPLSLKVLNKKLLYTSIFVWVNLIKAHKQLYAAQ